MKAYANNLEKLKMGTILRDYRKENGEPENIALGQVSKELKFLQRQTQYVFEIERVLKEIRLTVSLIKSCRDCEVPNGFSRQGLLAYYQGIFFTLVHQIKDKLTQLVNLMTEEAIPEKPTHDNKIKVSQLLDRKGKVIQDIGIKEEIEQWNDENPSGGIAVVLRKRTFHHHKISGLRYNEDFSNLDFTDIASQPSFQQNLTDYGKTHIAKMRAESTERLFSKALSDAENTLKEIETNIEKIAGELVQFFNLPITEEDAVKIINEQSAMHESFGVTNRCSIDKIPEPHRSLLNDLVKKTCEEWKDGVTSIYLVGSLGRGEYEEGYSDTNLFVIFDGDDVPVASSREDDKLSLKAFTKTYFLSEQGKKYRIIAKADGILLCGTDYVQDEKLPKAGMFLALTLNDDIIEILDGAKQWIDKNPSATPLQISIKSRKLAKRLIDFIYGVVMTNKPQYTPSRKERVGKILEMYPANRKMIEMLMNVTRYGVGESESFINLIDGFRAKAQMNLQKMRDVAKEIEDNQKHN